MAPAARMNPPDNEVPVALAWTAVLGRSSDVAVAVVGARAYSTGVVLDIAVRARHRPADPHGLFGAAIDDGADGLVIGVEFADGRTSAGSEEIEGLPDDTPLLFLGGGSGSELGMDMARYLTPLPPPGPLVVSCRWPAFGIVETRVELDPTGLADALDQVEVLWPR